MMNELKKSEIATQRPLHWVPGFFAGGEAAGRVKLTIHLHLVPVLRMSAAMPLLPMYAFMSWTETTLPFAIIYP